MAFTAAQNNRIYYTKIAA